MADTRVGLTLCGRLRNLKRVTVKPKNGHPPFEQVVAVLDIDADYLPQVKCNLTDAGKEQALKMELALEPHLGEVVIVDVALWYGDLCYVELVG